MKNNRAFLFLLIMALISPAMILICCVQREEEKSGIEITDMAGTKVVLNKTPSRAIFLAGESWVYALKIRDKVVAFSDLAKKNPVLLKIDPGVSDIPSRNLKELESRLSG
ncbi:MAG: hypothetical protein PWQ22_1119 [Archaeoglobaceae archaeon]|nr:hypothetical protein [Archaeoglobaceae archaeon]